MYVLDSSSLMEAKDSFFAFDIAPRFWELIVEAACDQKINSIDRVKTELLSGNDELAQWAKNDFHSYFESTNRVEIIEVYRNLFTWVNNQDQYKDSAKAEFAKTENADGWLIAYAKVENATVVTEEVYDPHIKRAVRIPNICEEFEVPYINFLSLIRELGIRWTS